MAVLVRVVVFNEKWLIVAPSEKKARIIMGYLIDHCFDSPLFFSQLEIDTPLERLKRERSKNHLSFRRGGEVMTLTLDARNSKRNLEAAMGFGAANVILDESSLIDDPLYSSVKRMLGGSSEDSFLFEIGNPFYRNHFHRTWHDPIYYKVYADYHTALEEGRYTLEFIEEMKKEAFFDVYYECLFPNENAVDIEGYRRLLMTEQIVQKEAEGEGKKKLGVDIGGGGDFSVFSLRQGNVGKIGSQFQSRDTMANVVEVIRFIEEEKVEPNNVAVDDTGIGRGVVDRLKEEGYAVNGVSFGGKARQSNKFLNQRAELYWLTKNWVEAGGILIPNANWQQLAWARYKVASGKQIKLEPKEDIIKRTGKSPDHADAFALTFYEAPAFGIL